jgi:hypothetical protein
MAGTIGVGITKGQMINFENQIASLTFKEGHE